MCLFSLLGILKHFLHVEREGLNLEDLSLRERKFDLRERLSLSRNDLLFPTLRMFLYSLSVAFSPR